MRIDRRFSTRYSARKKFRILEILGVGFNFKRPQGGNENSHSKPRERILKGGLHGDFMRRRRGAEEIFRRHDALGARRAKRRDGSQLSFPRLFSTSSISPTTFNISPARSVGARPPNANSAAVRSTMMFDCCFQTTLPATRTFRVRTHEHFDIPNQSLDQTI